MYPIHIYPKAKALSHPHSWPGPWPPGSANKLSLSVAPPPPQTSLPSSQKRSCTSRHLPHPLHLPGILLRPLFLPFTILQGQGLHPLVFFFLPPTPQTTAVTSSVDCRKIYIKNSTDAKNLFFRSMPLLEFGKLPLDIKKELLPLCCPQRLLHVAHTQMVTWPLFVMYLYMGQGLLPV